MSSISAESRDNNDIDFLENTIQNIKDIQDNQSIPQKFYEDLGNTSNFFDHINKTYYDGSNNFINYFIFILSQKVDELKTNPQIVEEIQKIINYIKTFNTKSSNTLTSGQQPSLPPPSLPTDQQQATQHTGSCTYYNKTSQRFIFPPCFLKNTRDNTEQKFFKETNLNMIIFELLIKLVDFMHDNVKDIDRIRESDTIILNMFAKKKKATKAFRSSKKTGGMPTNPSSLKVTDSSSLNNQQLNTTPTPTPTLLKLPGPTYNVASIKNLTNTNTENEIAKDQIPYVYYEMDDLFSIYINKILALLSPELLKYIEDINNEIDAATASENEKIDENEKLNTILFSSIIYIINVLITPYTGEYENNMYLTNFTIKQDHGSNRWVVDGDINEDINESNKSSSFGVKICKKAIMQSFIDIFLNDNNNIQNTNFFELLNKNYDAIYDKFIYYVETYFCNELCSSNDKLSQYGGVISIQKMVEIINKSALKPSKFINNIIIRLYVITLLKEFNIVTPLDSNNYNYKYTDFGNAINNGDYNAVNSLNDNAVSDRLHLSLFILSDILTYFDDIVQNKVIESANKFNGDFKKFEDTLWSNLHFWSSTIPGFYLERINCKKNKKNNEECCANKFIISNASTTVNLNQGNPCIFNSLASVLDPAGSTNINMNHDNYEYGNINCFVYGANNDNNDIQTEIYFNGKIDFLETSTMQGNKIYYLSNKSENKINSLKVECSIQVDYEKDGNNDVYKEIKKTTPSIFNIQSSKFPQSTELSSTRKQMTYNLLNALSKTYQTTRNQSSSTIYTMSLYDPVNKEYVQNLFGSTLNKTVGDLMQILSSLIKYGGITSFPDFLPNDGFHVSVIGFNEQGNALREINHHDLTASIINLFMLIFGSYTFDMAAASGGIKYYNNTGKNEGSYMADHRTTFMGFGTTENIHNTIVQHNKPTSDCNISNLKIVKIVDFEKQKNDEKDLERLKEELATLKTQLVEQSVEIPSFQQPNTIVENVNRESDSSSMEGSELPQETQEMSLGKRPPSNIFSRFSDIFNFKKPKTGGKTNKNHYIKKYKTSIKNGNKIKQNKKSLKNNKNKKNSNTYKNK